MNRSQNWYDNRPDLCEQSTFPFQKSDRYDNGTISFPCERSLSFKSSLETRKNHLGPCCEYEIYNLPSTNVNTGKDHGKTAQKSNLPGSTIFCPIIYSVHSIVITNLTYSVYESKFWVVGLLSHVKDHLMPRRMQFAASRYLFSFRGYKAVNTVYQIRGTLKRSGNKNL